MNEFKFNFCVPHKYKDKDTGEEKYGLVHGGEEMSVGTLELMQKDYVTEKTEKGACPWGQVFANGFRVTNDNADYSQWNGFTYSDIDSKWFFREVQNFDVMKLKDAINQGGQLWFKENYYAVYVTSSKQSYRIFWYWNCDRTEENWLKCAALTDKYVRQLFYKLGDVAKQIIDYSNNGKCVLDRCSKSVKQGFYVTADTIFYTKYHNEDWFGLCNLEDITLEQTYAQSNVVKITGDFKQGEHVRLIDIKPVDPNMMKYYPHHWRRCVYDALITMFGDKNTVDDYWMKIAGLMREGNGHDAAFYMKEPDKNKWYDRYDKEIYHDLSWLDGFGFTYENDSEYIYIRQFRKSWQNWLKKEAAKLYCDEHEDEIENEVLLRLSGGKATQKAINNMERIVWLEYYNKAMQHSIFDIDFYSFTNEKHQDLIDKYRSEYNKTRWKEGEFKFLVENTEEHYEVGRDMDTYKMYADFNYRDENNLPTVKYDVLADKIELYSYDKESNKVCWHQMKANDEYTHWCNEHRFSRHCTKENLRCAIGKYVPRWFGYNVLADYFNGLEGHEIDEEKLETLFIRYLKADDTPLIRTMTKNFWIAAVKKALIEDANEFVYQHILTLLGNTGSGKTTILKEMFTIGKRQFIVNQVKINMPADKLGPLLNNNLCVQFGEGKELTKAAAAEIKEFVDVMNMGVQWQKKWENEVTLVYPRCVAVATYNPDQKLYNDPTIYKDGDRRSHLIVCHAPAHSWNHDVQLKQLREEKDTLWATAVALYKKNPDANLELDQKMMDELRQVQESWQLIETEELKEVYNEIFDREYSLSSKGCFLDEVSFVAQCSRSEELLQYDNFENSEYCHKGKFKRIPVAWLKNYLVKNKGMKTNSITRFRQLLEEKGWESKVCLYKDHNMRCWEQR